MPQYLLNWFRFIRDGGLPADCTDIEELRQRRGVSLSILVLLPLGAIVLIMNVILDESNDNQFIFAALLVGFFALLLQAYAGARKTAANITLFALWLAPSLSMIDQGVHGISTIWLLILPIIATLILGSLGSLIWGMAALGTVWFYALLDTFIYREIEISSTPVAIGIEATVALTLVLGATMAFRSAQRSMEARLEESVAQLNREVEIRRQAELNARNAEQLKSEFLASMSHELRTPLNGVIGTMELLNHTRLDDEQQLLVDTVKSSGEILHNLIGDVLDLSRLDANRLELESEPIDLAHLCRSVCETLAITVDRSKVAIVPDIDRGIAWVRGDPVRLQQVLVNLIGNAVKFTHEGTITLQCTRVGRSVHLRVEDTGIGIPLSAQATLFDAYVQASESTTRHYGGSGLGLAIVYRLVKLMSGDIKLTSTPGEGSCFDVKLPLIAVKPPASVNSDSQSHDRNERPLNVLVADDNATNRLVASKMLTRLGHKVTEADDGQQAIDCVINGKIDLILMDVQMPVMDGKQATQEIRKLDNPLRGIPIVGLTANALPGDREALLAIGMDEYLSKPVRIRELNSVIERLPAIHPIIDGAKQ